MQASSSAPDRGQHPIIASPGYSNPALLLQGEPNKWTLYRPPHAPPAGGLLPCLIDQWHSLEAPGHPACMQKMPGALRGHACMCVEVTFRNRCFPLTAAGNLGASDQVVESAVVRGVGLIQGASAAVGRP